jgi:hypothetical protein
MEWLLGSLLAEPWLALAPVWVAVLDQHFLSLIKHNFFLVTCQVFFAKVD